MEMIAIDRKTVDELQSLLQETRAELKKVREQLDREDHPLTLTEAAKYLKVSSRQFYIYRERGEITITQYGDKVWVKRSALDEFLNRHTIKRRAA